MNVMPIEGYRSDQLGKYHLLPFRFTRLPDLPGEVLIRPKSESISFSQKLISSI